MPVISDLWPGQEELFNDTATPEIAIVAGNGYGKSTCMTKWKIDRDLRNVGCENSYVTSATNKLLRDLNIPMYRSILADYGFRETGPFPDFKVYESLGNQRIVYRWGRKVLFASADDSAVRNIVSVSASDSASDEPGLCSRVLPVELAKRVRDRNAVALQRSYWGTPEGINWFAAKFSGLDRDGQFSRHIDKDGKQKKLVLHGRTHDNPANPPEYLEGLYAEFSWNPNLILAYIEGLFVPIYEHRGFDFDPQKHFKDFVHPRQDRPLTLTWDFNVTQGREGGVSWCAVQENGADLWCVGENRHSSRTTWEAAEDFVSQFQPTPIRIRDFEDIDQSTGWTDIPIEIDGDANGHRRDTRTYTTDYEIIERVLLDAGFTNVKIVAEHSNPKVSYRLACTNRLFSDSYKKKLLLSPNCTKTGDSLMQTTLNKKGQVEKPAEEVHTHRAEALSYAVVSLRPMIKPTTNRAGVSPY